MRTSDGFHLSSLGRDYAVDMAAHLLTQMVAVVQASEANHGHGGAAGAPSRERAGGDVRHFLDHQVQDIPPMHAGLSHVPKTWLCLPFSAFDAHDDGAALRAMLAAANVSIRGTAGCMWGDESRHGGKKYGYYTLNDAAAVAAAAAGSPRHVDLAWVPRLPAADAASALSPGQAQRLVIVLGYLTSYTDDMGSAMMSCITGCVCKPVEVVALTEARVSVMALAQLVLDHFDDRAACIVRMSVSEGPKGGRKFKLLAVMVVEELANFVLGGEVFKANKFLSNLG